VSCSDPTEVGYGLKALGGEMSNFTRDACRVAPILLFILVTTNFDAAAQGRPSPDPQAQARMTRAVTAIFQAGVHAHLPPHTSTLLGLSVEKELAVMQSMVRTGQSVQGFDVSTANKNDVVIFMVDEASNDQTLYLSSPKGRLRRVVAIEKGVGRVRPVSERDKKGFAAQKQFWLDRLAPVRVSK
jgi:hypothetical protein